MQIVLLLFPRRHVPLFIVIGHQKQRGPFMYLFLKPLLGVHLSRLNFSLSFLSPPYIKQKALGSGPGLYDRTFQPWPVCMDRVGGGRRLYWNMKISALNL